MYENEMNALVMDCTLIIFEIDTTGTLIRRERAHDSNKHSENESPDNEASLDNEEITSSASWR